MAPMGMGSIAEPDGRWGERVLEYYLARARGETGLIITSLAPVTRKLELMWQTHIDFHNPAHMESLKPLARAIHSSGAKIFIQLTAGFGRVISAMRAAKSQPVSASAVPCFFLPQVLAREITTLEVEELVEAFGFAARACRESGIDGVELHGHEGYLLDQFTTSLWNKRKDKYGGSLEGRLRLPLEAIASIKTQAGKDFPVIYRYGIDHHLEGGRKVAEALEIAKRLEKAGVDALHVDAGCYETSWWPHPTIYQPPAFMADMAEAVKKVVKIPVITVGKLWYPELAEKVLQEGKADFIALGRGLLADPEWPLKVKQGRTDDIRICIGDHDGCMVRLHAGKGTSCTVNPQAGMEKGLALTRTDKKKNVLIVGGGPAGMEAARVARIRGHEVTLWEKSSDLGGNLIPASIPDFKRDMKIYLEYQIRQLRKLGVKIETNREATFQSIQKAAPQSVVLASGATAVIPNVPGIHGNNVITAIDLLLGRGKTGEEIIILGGGLVGCETAVYLAQKGKKVTILKRSDTLLPDMYLANRNHLLLLLSQNKVNIVTGIKLEGVTRQGLTISKGGNTEDLKANTIVLSMGMEPRKELAASLQGKVPELHIVGDCVEPRRMINAIWEGFHAGLAI